MRLAQTVYCILALVAGLVYAPFFHLHADEHSELHAHFDAPAGHAGHHDDDHDVAVESSDEEHDATAVSVFVAQTPDPELVLIGVQQTHVVIPVRTLIGFVVEQPVRAHDPPGYRPSNPRSPPA